MREFSLTTNCLEHDCSWTTTRAENVFINLLKNSASSDVVKDTVRELAVLSSELRKEDKVLSLAQQLFSQNLPVKIEFLTSAYSNLRRINPNLEYSLIFSELIKTANTPEKRVRLWLDEMNAHDRPYASRVHSAAF